jgi:hypothetical protein
VRGAIGGVVVWNIFSSSMFGSPYSRVSVVGELLANEPVTEDDYPGIDDVRRFILSCFTNTDAEDRRLQEICHHLDRKCAMMFGRLLSAA